MKAFAVGLLFLVAVGILAGLGVMLYPLIIVLGLFLRMLLSCAFVILSIWLLGKLIILIWERIFSRRSS